ncbi:c-type cytochrome [Benzoatithermus flavus]|uniref:C-type cytochrome n=1 Tax=Benzoatithermus flavus TaxID=3108223 RepID=A0ABU8XS15_9PROT
MRSKTLILTLGLAAMLPIPTGAARAADEATLRRGAYLARIMDCAGCHTQGALIGQPDPKRHLAGSDIGFGIPGLGVFYPRNLTPDPETGLGAWSEVDIVRAVRTGQRPDGRELAPAMPWRSYAALSDADAAALAAYLKSLEPVRNEVPPIAGPSEKPAAPYLTVAVP